MQFKGIEGRSVGRWSSISGKGRDAIGATLRSLLGLAAGAEAEERQAAAERVVTAGIVSAERLVFLSDLLDLPQRGEGRALYDAMDNAARNRGKRALMAALTEDAFRRGPIMTVVEDLHWADPQILGHLAAIAAAIGNGPGGRSSLPPAAALWFARCKGMPTATSATSSRASEPHCSIAVRTFLTPIEAAIGI
jgi:predicted ATPase